MSNHAVTWAWNVPSAGPAQLLVLVCLADHANEHRDKTLKDAEGTPIPHRGDIVWLPIAELMKKTKLVRSTVIKALRDNERDGYIRNHGAQHPWSKSNVYELSNRLSQARATQPDATHATDQRHYAQPKPGHPTGPATATNPAGQNTQTARRRGQDWDSNRNAQTVFRANG